MNEIHIGQATALTSPDPLVLVCTKKADGTLNMAPVSFFMYASFDSPMLAFGMGKASNSGENIRRDKKAVVAVPGTSIAEAVMAYGSANGGKKDKLAEDPIALQSVDGTDIRVPEDCRAAFVAITISMSAISRKCTATTPKKRCSRGTDTGKWLRHRETDRSNGERRRAVIEALPRNGKKQKATPHFHIGGEEFFCLQKKRKLKGTVHFPCARSRLF